MIGAEMSEQSPSVSRQDLRRLLASAVHAEPAGPLEPVLSAALSRVEKLRAAPECALSDTRLDEIERLAALVADKDWIAPPSVAPRVRLALTQFVDGSSDLDGRSPPDTANLSQVLAEELRHELQGFADFCASRERLRSRRFADGRQRERRLLLRRRQIRARIQGRRWRHASG